MAENDNPKSLMTTNDHDNDDNVLELCVLPYKKLNDFAFDCIVCKKIKTRGKNLFIWNNIVKFATDRLSSRLVVMWLLQKEKMGKENYYINTRLMNLFIEFGRYEPTEAPVNIESVHVNETPNL